MERRYLGQTGLEVSRLCFGTLTMGPLQANLPVEQGAELICQAAARGVNFFDTAQSYKTYPYLRAAMGSLTRSEMVIATKTYAYTEEGAREALEEALQELHTDYIDIVLLHEQESELTLQGHAEALEYLWRAKEQGRVRAVGISTHHVAAALGSVSHPLIEVVHPLFNMQGIGIQDGGAAEMAAAVAQLAGVGKGVYGMKALGGGHLIPRWQDAMRYVLANPHLAAVAVGMQSVDELDANLATFGGRSPKPQTLARLKNKRRYLHVEEWCQGCGRCMAVCPSDALSVVGSRIQVDHDRCVTCGYCAGRCPDFCLKVL